MINDSVNCSFCDKELKRLDPGVPNTLQKLTSLMFDGGGVGEISLNYGSKHDGDTYGITLCDECISKLTKEQKIIFLYNCMRSI